MFNEPTRSAVVIVEARKLSGCKRSSVDSCEEMGDN